MVRAEFAHLNPEEKVIMQRWVNLRPLVGEITYDIHLNTPDQTWPEHFTEEDKKRWRYLKDKRIDAICHTRLGNWILEVTPKLTPRTLGELIMYRDLYLKQVPQIKPVKLGAIVELDDPALHETFRREDIVIWVV